MKLRKTKKKASASGEVTSASKKKAAPKKSAPKKPAARQPAKPASKPKGPFVVVPNHRFAPGTEVGFHLLHTVEIERREGREPVPAPVKTVKVKARGLLEVNGLPKGQWCASGQVGDRWLYLTFPVR